MMKLLGTVLVCGSCTVFGVAAWQQLRKRLQAIDAVLQALAYMAAEIKEHRTPLPKIIENLVKSRNWIVAFLFRALQEKMKQNTELSFSYLWCRTFLESKESIGLHKEDITVLCDAAGFLGRYDVQQQLDGLSRLQRELERLRKEAREEVRTRGKIYRSCGVAVGAVLVLTLL